MKGFKGGECILKCLLSCLPILGRPSVMAAQDTAPVDGLAGAAIDRGQLNELAIFGCRCNRQGALS